MKARPPSKFLLEALPNGQAELNLTFQLPPASEVIPPPAHVLPTSAPQRPIHLLFPDGHFPQWPSGADSKKKHASPKKVSSRQRKSYWRSVLHRAALAAPSLPPPKNGSLRQAALACVQRLQGGLALSLSTPSAKKRPLPDSPNAPFPSNLPPLAQRIRKDIQVGESEVKSPENEVLRSTPFLGNSPSPISPGLKGIPSPVPLVLTPVVPEKLSLNCLNCDAKMTLDHQCEAVDSDSSWEDLESEEELYPTFDPDSKNWAEEFSNSIQRFHGSSPLI